MSPARGVAVRGCANFHSTRGYQAAGEREIDPAGERAQEALGRVIAELEGRAQAPPHAARQLGASVLDPAQRGGAVDAVDLGDPVMREVIDDLELEQRALAIVERAERLAEH